VRESTKYIGRERKRPVLDSPGSLPTEFFEKLGFTSIPWDDTDVVSMIYTR